MRSNAYGRGNGSDGLESFDDPSLAIRERNAREEPVTRIAGKWCCSCRQWLPVEAFRPNPNNRNGIDSWCRACHADAVRNWREKNGAEYNARRRREYREANPLTTRPCAVCGRPMTKSANTLVCGAVCRRQRKLEQRRALRIARRVISPERASRDE